MKLTVALARYLEVQGLVDFDEAGVAGNTFVDTLPSGPDLAVGLFSSGGVPWAGHGSLPTDEPTVQVRVRSERYDPRPGLQLAWDIYHALVGMTATVLDPGGDAEVYVHRCLALQTGPTSIGQDENQRPEFTINLALRVRAPSAHRT